MKMTKEEAIAILQEEYDYCKSGYDLEADPEEECLETTKYLRALHVAISALREMQLPNCEICNAYQPEGEEVEQVWKGEWVREVTPSTLPGRTISHCSKCFYHVYWPEEHINFCPHCGAPMTDEAVKMVIERLEGLCD